MTPKAKSPKTSKTSETLTTRQLNRALLARQMLLERERMSSVAAVERIAGMQAQVPRPPFMGLWTRLENFTADQLLKALNDKKIVRATAMRGTIHLLSTKDFIAFRPVLAEMLRRGAAGILGKRMEDADLQVICATGRAFFGKQPSTFEEFREHLETAHPDWDVRAMAYTVRMHVPLVMVPSGGTWGFPASAGFTLADKWLGKPIPEMSTKLEALVLRYLAAFGPATPADAQTWSAIQGLRPTFEKLRPKLAVFRDERNRELFDLPDAPRPDEDEPAPVRFLPEFDNALLAHDDRTRIIDTAHRPRVFLKNLQVLGTVLVDGFVAGTWRVERKKKSAALNVEMFGATPKPTAAAIEAEGEQLLAFLEPEAAERSVSVRRKA
ncbi:MAG TPA: winged helix DNA-binding domain-containing protein [Gemmatimonadaceae bacterium]|nr:winged helix DNA-binding domain-containing protein [Gemmatimonadaceae bacterium]